MIVTAEVIHKVLGYMIVMLVIRIEAGEINVGFACFVLDALPFVGGKVPEAVLQHNVHVQDVARLLHDGRRVASPENAVVLPFETPRLVDAVQAALKENLNRQDSHKGRSDALLLGLLYDDRGNRMSPSHAVKKGVRYRYYVSSPIAQGRKHEAGSLCRAPANAIEQAVTDALRSRLEGTRSNVRLDRTAKDLLRNVHRIDLWADRILITMLADESASGGVMADDDEHPAQDIGNTLAVPWRPPSAHRKRDIILPVEGRSQSELKPLRNEERVKLLRAIAMARSLRDALLPGAREDLNAIGSRFGKTERWVRNRLTLAFLDPKLVEAAVEGALPRGYGLSRFLELPADWDAQWRVLGLNNPRQAEPTRSC
jgi:hypothetical protein